MSQLRHTNTKSSWLHALIDRDTTICRDIMKYRSHGSQTAGLQCEYDDLLLQHFPRINVLSLLAAFVDMHLISYRVISRQSWLLA